MNLREQSDHLNASMQELAGTLAGWGIVLVLVAIFAAGWLFAEYVL